MILKSKHEYFESLPKFWTSHGSTTVSPITALKVLPLDINLGPIPSEELLKTAPAKKVNLFDNRSKKKKEGEGEGI